MIEQIFTKMTSSFYGYFKSDSLLQLYAETLDWDSDQIGVDPEYPEIPEWKRKEMIYNQVQQYFDKGKVKYFYTKLSTKCEHCYQY